MFLHYASMFLLSMVPLIELRGAIPIAIGMGLELIPSVAVCVLGNILPVPIIYLFARRFLLWGLDKRVVGSLCRFFHTKGEQAGKKLQASKFGKYGILVALTAFVGIPIPGTGAWTGTLGASFLDIGLKNTVVSVGIGVIFAGIIMTVVSMVGLHIFGL